MTGSNRARTTPTRTFASRSCVARSANRASSRASVPSDVTSTAASKLSCAMSATSARSCCARIAAGDIRRWNTTLAMTASGRTTSAATRQPDVGAHQLDGRDDDHHDDADRERQRVEDRRRRLDVRAGVREQLARRVLAVPRHRQPQVLAGDGRCGGPPGAARTRGPRTCGAPRPSGRATRRPARSRRPRARSGPAPRSSPASAGTTTWSVTAPSTRLTPTVRAPKSADVPMART